MTRHSKDESWAREKNLHNCILILFNLFFISPYHFFVLVDLAPTLCV